MKTKLRLALMLALCFSGPIHSADIPQSSRYDKRIQHVNYNDGDVVIIRALPGLGLRIVFAKNENILDIASGFTQGWEFKDRDNILYVKPKSVVSNQGQEQLVFSPEAGDWDTNLMVRTNQRLYDFDLKLLPGGGNSSTPPKNQPVAYRVEFHYPADELAKSKEEMARAKARARLDEKPAPRNWNYTMQIGDRSQDIAPTMAYDDGRFTYLKFPNNRDFPAAFIVAADESESLVNSHVDNDTLVLHRIAREMVLRLGDAVVGIYNENYDIDGLAPTNSTTVPGVHRVIVGDNKR